MERQAIGLFIDPYIQVGFGYIFHAPKESIAGKRCTFKYIAIKNVTISVIIYQHGHKCESVFQVNVGDVVPSSVTEYAPQI